MKPLHDYILVRPYKKDGKIWTPAAEDEHPVTQGTVMDTGPYANHAAMMLEDEIYFEDELDMEATPLRSQRKQSNKRETKHKSNEVSVGDIVYFPSMCAFNLGTLKEPIYAVKTFELIAVERLDDIE